jgi:hypothetical protein
MKLKVGDIVGRKHRKHDRLGMVVDAEPFGPMDFQPFEKVEVGGG